MKYLFPIPKTCLDLLRRQTEAGIGCQIVSVELKDGRTFDRVLVSEGCIMEVRGYEQVPFTPDDVASVSVNHRRCNFREGSNSRLKSRAAAA
jgi:hypothetical protein